jgi:hypothetical protein
VDGLINHVAAANVSEGREAPDAVRALVWHPAGVLLLGTESGARRALAAARTRAREALQWCVPAHVRCAASARRPRRLLTPR